MRSARSASISILMTAEDEIILTDERASFADSTLTELHVW